jgi:hypothetical protein
MSLALHSKMLPILVGSLLSCQPGTTETDPTAAESVLTATAAEAPQAALQRASKPLPIFAYFSGGSRKSGQLGQYFYLSGTCDDFLHDLEEVLRAAPHSAGVQGELVEMDCLRNEQLGVWQDWTELSIWADDPAGVSDVEVFAARMTGTRLPRSGLTLDLARAVGLSYPGTLAALHHASPGGSYNELYTSASWLHYTDLAGASRSFARVQRALSHADRADFLELVRGLYGRAEAAAFEGSLGQADGIQIDFSPVVLFPDGRVLNRWYVGDFYASIDCGRVGRCLDSASNRTLRTTRELKIQPRRRITLSP